MNKFSQHSQTPLWPRNQPDARGAALPWPHAGQGQGRAVRAGEQSGMWSVARGWAFEGGREGRAHVSELRVNFLER